MTDAAALAKILSHWITREGDLRDCIAGIQAAGFTLSRPAKDVTESARDLLRECITAARSKSADDAIAILAAALTARDARAAHSADIETIARGITGDEDHEPLSALGHVIVSALQRERTRAADAVAAERERCAKIADDDWQDVGAHINDSVTEAGSRIAAAIRRVPP